MFKNLIYGTLVVNILNYNRTDQHSFDTGHLKTD